jgi:hypothetical protein
VGNTEQLRRVDEISAMEYSLSLSSQWSEKAQEKREVSVLKTTQRERKERFWSSFWRFLTSLLSRAFSLPLCFCVCSRCFPSHKTNRRRLKREVCFENDRERVGEGAFLVGAF